MKFEIETPIKLVDITQLELKQVEPTVAGGLRIGALVTNSDLAAHPSVIENYPVLSRAILAGATGQLRNKATTGVTSYSVPAAITSISLIVRVISAIQAVVALPLTGRIAPCYLGYQ
nr:FAD binding domain-containing protein [Psychrobacter sp. PraFG1]UTT87728.1 FAD binding domain-containing protein [Psychrobacter sp. PraFG1]